LIDEQKTATDSELRSFGLLTGALFVAIFGLAFPALRHHRFPAWPWVIAIALAIPALVYPRSLYYVHWIWTRIGIVLGWINSRIILTLLFFVVILPMGLLMRAFGRDPISRKFEPDAETYRVPSRKRARETMEMPF